MARKKTDTVVSTSVGIQYLYGYKGFEEPEVILGQVKFSEGTAPTKSIAYYITKRPLLAFKKTASGKTQREYVDANAVAAAIAAGWNIMATYRGVRRVGRAATTARVVAMSTKLATDLYYCWNMRKATQAAIGSAALGAAHIVAYDAAARKNDGVFGANFVVLKEDFDGIPKGVIIPRKALLTTVAGADGFDHRTYSGVAEA